MHFTGSGRVHGAPWRFTRPVSADSLRPRGIAARPPLWLVWVGIAVLSFAGCRRSESVGAPSDVSPYLGTWSGSIAFDAIGSGAIVVDLSTQIGGNASGLLSGTYRRTRIPQGEAEIRGLVAGSGGREGRGLMLTFESGAVPCPVLSSGTAERAIVAQLELSAGQLRGTFIAGECSGGTMELRR